MDCSADGADHKHWACKGQQGEAHQVESSAWWVSSFWQKKPGSRVLYLGQKKIFKIQSNECVR